MELNKQLLADVINQIITHPETHNQSIWHCGTSHCVAGWTQVLGHGPRDQYPANVMEDAADLLGLSLEDADYLFSAELTISSVYRRASQLITGTGGGRYEYDQYGYNYSGRDRDGYNRDGRDRDGYDRDGYDCSSRDRRGYDRDGYDRDAYCRDGRDREGRDLDGRDQDGNSLPLIVVD